MNRRNFLDDLTAIMQQQLKTTGPKDYSITLPKTCEPWLRAQGMTPVEHRLCQLLYWGKRGGINIYTYMR